MNRRRYHPNQPSHRPQNDPNYGHGSFQSDSRPRYGHEHHNYGDPRSNYGQGLRTDHNNSRHQNYGLENDFGPQSSNEHRGGFRQNAYGSDEGWDQGSSSSRSEYSADQFEPRQFRRNEEDNFLGRGTNFDDEDYGSFYQSSGHRNDDDAISRADSNEIRNRRPDLPVNEFTRRRNYNRR